MPRDPAHDILFEPVRIGPKTLRNRFFQVPQCTGAGNNQPGANAGHRAVKAEGGWAALCTESCMIHPETDQPVATVSTLYDEGDIANHRHMTDSVHAFGALAGVELCHAGGLASALTTRSVVATAHQFATPWIPQVSTYEAEDADFRRIIRLYAEAARRAVEAGFDIVYIHGTHGAMPVQMLSPFHNRRTDRWGGSFENRARFWLEVLEAVRTVVDGRCAVANRFSIDQLSGPGGVEAEADGLRFVELVARLGLVDLWDVNISSLEEWGEDAAPSRFQASNHQAPWTSKVRAVAGVPVVGVGRFTDPDEMARIVRSGQYDIIGCARPSIADPFLPRKVDEGRIDEITECIGCNQCIARFEHGVTIGCTQNPTALEEYRRGWHPERFEPAASDELILVVGGGPAGLECARVLARRGYRTHLVEAERTLGGHMRDIVRLPGLAAWGRAVAVRETVLRRMPRVEVMRGTGVVTADDLLAYGADRIVLATGARWRTDGSGSAGPDPIAGIDAASAVFATPEQVMAGKSLGRRVAILDSDGYFMAISLAEMLADRGHAVTLVTPFDRVAPFCDLTLEGPNLRRMMREKGIAGLVGHWVERAEPGSEVRLRLYDLYRDGSRRTATPRLGDIPRAASTEVIDAGFDSVVLCTGRRSEDGLYRALAGRRDDWASAGLKDVYRIGDCLAPRYIADAVFDGHRMGREISSPDPHHPLPPLRERPIWTREERETGHGG